MCYNKSIVGFATYFFKHFCLAKVHLIILVHEVDTDAELG